MDVKWVQDETGIGDLRAGAFTASLRLSPGYEAKNGLGAFDVLKKTENPPSSGPVFTEQM